MDDRTRNPTLKRGRPITRRIEIHATADQIANAIFAAANTPDPSKRITKRQKVKSAQKVGG